MRSVLYFNEVWNDIFLLTNIKPNTDSVPARIFQVNTEIDPTKAEEALLWLADATIGRESLNFFDCGDPAQVAGYLNILVANIRDQFPNKSEISDLQIWSDMYAAFCLGYLAPKSSTFINDISKKPGSIFELMAA